VIVHFNSVDEFLKELGHLRPADLPEKLVRVSGSYRSATFSPTVKHVSVIATVLKVVANVPCIIRLDRYCGDYWGEHFERKALDQSNKITKRIEKEAKQLGYEIRHGVYEEENKE
jgi:hypothetical protein